MKAGLYDEGSPAMTSAYLERVYAADTDHDAQAASWLIFDAIDSMCWRGEFGEIDAILAAADVSRLSTSAMRSLLVITYPARDQLPSRAALYDRVREAMTAIRGEAVTARLLGRLRA